MQIFISYSHSDGGDFASRLYDFLVADGHEVWMDRLGGINTGENYDTEIDRGLDESEVFIAVLTQGYVRDQGYCLNELHRACDDCKLIIPIMCQRCRPPTIIYRKQYLDYSTYGDSIFNMLSARIAGSQGRRHLTACVLPGGVKPQVERLAKDFSSREWINERIDQAFDRDGYSGVLITGLPGSGKSAFLAHLAKTDDRVGAIFFCNIKDARSLSAHAFVLSIADQLADHLPGFRDRSKQLRSETRGEAVADMLLDQVLRPMTELPGDQSETWVLVDAIEEARELAAGEALLNSLDILVKESPRWLRLICSSRPSRIVQNQLHRFKVIPLEREEIHEAEDIRRYVTEKGGIEPLRTRLHRLGTSPEKLSDHIHKKAPGCFLYAKAVLDELSRSDSAERGWDAIPGDIDNLYYRAFRSRFENEEEYAKQVAPILEVVSQSCQPLSVQTLASFLSLEVADVRRVLRRLEGLMEDGGDIVDFGNRTLLDWLSDPSRSMPYELSLGRGELLLTKACKRWKEFIRSEELYPLRWGPLHAVRAGDLNTALEYLLNREYRSVFKQVWGEEEWGVHLARIMDEADKDLLQSIQTAIRRTEDAFLAADLGHMAYRRDRLDDAEMMWDAAISFADKAQEWNLLAESLARRGWVESSRGHRERAEAYYRRCADVSKQHNSEPGLMRAYQHFARIYERKADYANALKCYENVIELAQRLGRPEREMSALCAMGELLLRSGSRSEAASTLEKAISIADKRGSSYHKMVGLTLWARTALGEANPPMEAIKGALCDALRLAEARQTARGIGEASRTLGELAIRQGNSDEAARWLERAIRELWKAGPRFVTEPLHILVSMTSEGDRFEKSIEEVRTASIHAGSPSLEVLEARKEREVEEVSSSVTLIARRPIRMAHEILELAKSATNDFPSIGVHWPKPGNIHFTIMPLKRRGRMFSAYPPPLSSVLSLATAVGPVSLRSVGGIVVPSGGLVLALQPTDQSLAVLRLGLRTLIPEIDDTSLPYFPHLSVGRVTSVSDPVEFSRFSRAFPRVFEPFEYTLEVQEVALVNYIRRDLDAIRGEIIWPLTPDNEKARPFPTDGEICDALSLSPKIETGLLDSI